MLDSKGFDEFADEYDKWAKKVDEDNAYPFAGYQKVLDGICDLVLKKPQAKILDVGFGTGTLDLKLYEKGYEIYGQDYSTRMLEIASTKMQNAKLYKGDFTQGLVDDLKINKYDFIIATYALHHLNDEKKISFINYLFDYLNDDGSILIGDISFRTREDLEECKRSVKGEWDEEEIYIVVDELKRTFNNLVFYPTSFCGGYLVIKKHE